MPPERAVPRGRWGRTLVVAAVLAVVALAGWEAYWRSQWFRPSYRNSDGLWAMTRDRLDREGPGGTVIVGSSRAQFDLNLETWREETGTVPVQLALEGTSPRPLLSHLADETDFSGLVVVGVTPPLFFTPGFGYRAHTFRYWKDETIAERIGQRLSMAVEPYLAFYNFDTALFTVVRRQRWWPVREGVYVEPVVRKLANMRRTRQSDMWSRVELDPEYRETARNTWLAILEAPRPMPPAEEIAKMLDAALDEVAEDVRVIRARGGEVVFVRPPSSGPFREMEAAAFPRETHWDELLRRADAVGVHFEDHADLRDVETPEWSHVRSGDTPRYTRALIGFLREGLAGRGTPREELLP